ncbi:MAG TPA: extracellular solute-binding protein [Chthoniobacteraceae bacterium]|nr:extracellular solute-binding protein [Chthoniobacteraceae bacterium]
MREKLFNFIGLALLALCFAASLVRTLSRHASTSEDGQPQRITIRFAHWQLEDGPREAFARIAAEYSRLHPEVRIEQLPIPERVFSSWLVTQLVGGTAPDIIELGKGLEIGQLVRYFVPLSDLAEAPNPYNHGTPLEGLPLRETFFDGMEGGYNPLLLEYYGVPISGGSIRLFYNLELLERITGSRRLPRTSGELMALCEKIARHAAKEGVPLVPIAGSRYNAPFLMEALFSSQTQKLAETLNPPGIIDGNPVAQASGYLEGRWNLRSDAVRSGLTLMREVGRAMQPGFSQIMRDDATLLFVQNRAVMICTGSWDATSIRRQITFPLGVSPIPFPSPNDPVYGPHTLGARSEAGVNAGISFGLTRYSSHPEVAADFLLFLASRQANQLWTDVSGWIPSILTTRPGPEVEPFLPVLEGWLPGLMPSISKGFADTSRLFNTSFHLLVSPFGSVEAMIDTLEDDYPEAIRRDLERERLKRIQILQRGDTQLAALAWLARDPAAPPADRARLDLLLQADSTNQRNFYRTRFALEKAGTPSP